MYVMTFAITTILTLFVMITVMNIVNFNLVVHATVDGPEYCPPSSTFDIDLRDCLFADGRGNLFPDGSFCGLEGCYNAEGKPIGIWLSPFHPSKDIDCKPGELWSPEKKCVTRTDTFRTPETKTNNHLPQMKHNQ